jgi:hypothetical protein
MYIGAIGALMNRVLQPRPLVVLGLNVWMGTAAGADELVEIPGLLEIRTGVTPVRTHTAPRLGSKEFCTFTLYSPRVGYCMHLMTRITDQRCGWVCLQLCVYFNLYENT